jgi:hypothetical protein
VVSIEIKNVFIFRVEEELFETFWLCKGSIGEGSDGPYIGIDLRE